MKIKYDPEADALYIRFREGPVTSKHVDDDITIDFSEGNKIAGIEILDATERMGSKGFIERLTREEDFLFPWPEVSLEPVHMETNCLMLGSRPDKHGYMSSLNCQRVREDSGLSIEELASSSSLSPDTIKEIEKGVFFELKTFFEILLSINSARKKKGLPELSIGMTEKAPGPFNWEEKSESKKKLTKKT